MSRLSVGHGFVDMCQGAVPALLPTLIDTRGLNLASATALVSIASIGSAIVQPLFGIWSDRITAPLLAPLGVALAAVGLALVGICHTYLELAFALAASGLGVALFHPEGARMAHLVGGGSVRGMSYFSVGGNAGFALGPLAVLLILAIGGISATPLLVIPGAAVAALLVLDVGRFKGHLQAEHRSQQTRGAEQKAQWGPFTRLVGAAVARTVPFYTVLALVPIYAVRRLRRKSQHRQRCVDGDARGGRGRHAGRRALRRSLREARGADLGNGAAHSVPRDPVAHRARAGVRHLGVDRLHARRPVLNDGRARPAVPARTPRAWRLGSRSAWRSEWAG